MLLWPFQSQLLELHHTHCCCLSFSHFLLLFRVLGTTELFKFELFKLIVLTNTAATVQHKKKLATGICCTVLEPIHIDLHYLMSV